MQIWPLFMAIKCVSKSCWQKRNSSADDPALVLSCISDTVFSRGKSCHSHHCIFLLPWPFPSLPGAEGQGCKSDFLVCCLPSQGSSVRRADSRAAPGQWWLMNALLHVQGSPPGCAATNPSNNAGCRQGQEVTTGWYISNFTRKMQL